jgi:hypothetical protein
LRVKKGITKISRVRIAIGPGLFVTNVLNDVVGLEKVEETYNSLLGLNPTGRNGKPEQARTSGKRDRIPFV